MAGLQTRPSLTSLYGRPPSLTTGYGPYASRQQPGQAFPYDPQTEANRQRDVLESQQGLNLRQGTAQADEYDAERQRTASMSPITTGLARESLRQAEAEPTWRDKLRETATSNRMFGDVDRQRMLEDEERHRGQALSDEQRRGVMLKSLMASLTGPSADLPEVSRTGGSVGGEEDAAQAAAFARAKDQAGEIARSSLTALRSQGGATGRLGSGSESRATQGVLSSAASDLGNISREQAIQNAERARRAASEEYQGRIAQRGQNISRRAQLLATLPSLASLFRTTATV